MYKKIMLSLLLLPFFSNVELFCSNEDYTDEVLLENFRVTTTLELQVRAAEVWERLNFITTGQQFRECMRDSKPEDIKDVKGIPVKCKDFARAFVACGGVEALAKIITDLEIIGD